MTVLQSFTSKTLCRAVAAGFDTTFSHFPPLVRIETTNACNARCTMCPHRALRRPIASMDDATYCRVVDECAVEHCAEIHLHNFGEPLLDRKLEQRIDYAKRRGIRKVKIFSNGSLLTEERARGLIEAGLDEIKISFDGATREEFERIRVPLEFDAIVENICRLVTLRNIADSPLRIYVACCSTSDKQATMQTLEQLVDGLSFGKIHNWTGGHNVPPRRGVRKPCSRLWRTMTVLAGGEIALCCLDYDGRHLLGRIDGRLSLAEIWRSDAYRRVRQLHCRARQDEIELCAGCTKSFV